MWFEIVTYWLVPSGEPLPVLPTDSDELTAKERLEPFIHNKGPATRAEAEVGTAEIRKWFRRISEAEAKLYNAQPNWRLRDIGTHRAPEITAILKEFLTCTLATSSAYDWPNHAPTRNCDWRIHGWKHISYESIIAAWEDSQSAWDIFPRIEALGDETQVRQLFSAAARGDAEACGIVWSWFPSAEEQGEILDLFFLPQERPFRVPHPSEIASDLLDVMFSSPHSEESDSARKTLAKLTSKSVAKGLRTGKGRPKTLIATRILRLLWKMSYCLATQVREVHEFLRLSSQSNIERTLLQLYPWIDKSFRNVPDFLSYEKNKVSLAISSHITGLSISTIEKKRLRSKD
jgi:hypothetical protein